MTRRAAVPGGSCGVSAARGHDSGIERYPEAVPAAAPSIVGNKPSFVARYLFKRARLCSTLLGGRPAVTYAAYRTASTAIHHAIRSAGNGVALKAHMLAPQNLVSRVAERHRFSDAAANLPRSCHVGDWAVRLGVIEPRREADFVVSIRDPWSVAHSIFVLSAARLEPEIPRLAAAGDAASLERAVDLSEAIIYGAFPRELMLRWIRDDLAPALAWDPLSSSFDAEAGVDDYEVGPWRLQIMRADLPDERKSESLRRFLGRPSISVKRTNASVAFAPVNEAIGAIGRRAIARRPDAVRSLLEDAACAHFWPATAREGMWRRWSAADRA